MKLSTLLSAALPAFAAAQPGGPWWGGGPSCARNCLSSAWSASPTWPSPGSFCSGPTAAPVASCINAACGSTPTAVQSWSSISASLCNHYASCVAAGSTGVYTITATGPWGPGGTHHWGPGGPPGSWTTGGVYTVTGCPWSGSPWVSGGGNGWGGPGNGWGTWGGGNGWGPQGPGWTYYTQMSTVTSVWVSNGVLVTTTGVATVAEAISGGVTSITTFGLGPTATNAAPAPTADLAAVKVMGAVLGGVVAVAGVL